jgi:hypothetical protein
MKKHESRNHESTKARNEFGLPSFRTFAFAFHDCDYARKPARQALRLCVSS